MAVVACLRCTILLAYCNTLVITDASYHNWPVPGIPSTRSGRMHAVEPATKKSRALQHDNLFILVRTLFAGSLSVYTLAFSTACHRVHCYVQWTCPQFAACIEARCALHLDLSVEVHLHAGNQVLLLSCLHESLVGLSLLVCL